MSRFAWGQQEALHTQSPWSLEPRSPESSSATTAALALGQLPLGEKRRGGRDREGSVSVCKPRSPPPSQCARTLEAEALNPSVSFVPPSCHPSLEVSVETKLDAGGTIAFSMF